MKMPDMLTLIAGHTGPFCKTEGRVVSYPALTKAVQWNVAALEKLGFAHDREREGQPLLGLDIALGWRSVPVLLAAFALRVTVMPIDPGRNPRLAESQLAQTSPALTVHSQMIDEDGCMVNFPEVFPIWHQELADTAVLMYTSGTSGHPKGVMLTYDNLSCNAAAILGYLNLQSADCLYLLRPLTHASSLTGELLPALVRGCVLVMKSQDQPPLTAIREMAQTESTILCTTPTVAARLSHFANRYDLSSLRHLYVSGERLSASHFHRIQTGFSHARIGNAFGLTEASPRISCKRVIEDDADLDNVGTVLPDVQIRIVNDHGELLPDGERGHLQAAGPNIMKGYFRDPTATTARLQGGWLATGDIASIRDGELYVHGRADHMIVRAGINVDPLEIESWLLQLDEVEEAVVFGKLDTGDVRNGMRVHAWIVPQAAVKESELYDRILSHLTDSRLSIDHLVFKQELPKTSSGKQIRPNMNEGR
ncbi:class I adenylate-forming enzyme family protein [Marinicrinis sediminis]|uniref:Class I adenylate-forming enzyme family protein n=1 Tax=Marinicrinis sediminis TaxID=1652465 RepID=A0ABW5RE15_9BACL